MDLAGKSPGRPRLINMYGTTETTVHASIERSPLPMWTGAVSPIGAPLAQLRRFLCWMGGCVRCRPGWSGSCMWPVAAWRVGMWAGPG